MSWYRIPDPNLEIPPPPRRGLSATRRFLEGTVQEASLAGSLMLALGWGLAELALILTS
jgi:hypothetical protein